MSNRAIVMWCPSYGYSLMQEGHQKMKNRVDTSRNKTPWDNIEDVTTLQSFIKNKNNEKENKNYYYIDNSNINNYSFICTISFKLYRA